MWHDASSRNQRDAKLLLCSYNILVPFLSFARALCNDNCFVERYAPSSCKLHLCARRPATCTPDSLRYSLPLKFCEFREFVFSVFFSSFALASKILTFLIEQARKTQNKITAHAFLFFALHFLHAILRKSLLGYLRNITKITFVKFRNPLLNFKCSLITPN